MLDREDRLLARAKVPTTPTCPPASPPPRRRSPISAPIVRITHAMLGTTHATNAVLERRHLRRVAVIRIGAPRRSRSGRCSWPEDLRATISVGEEIVRGGFEFDGREIVALEPDEIARFAASVAGRAECVAISSVFAPVSAEHELTARDIVRKELGHDARLAQPRDRLDRAARAGERDGPERSAHRCRPRRGRRVPGALEACGLDPITFFAQNDGTLMDLEYALRYPVLTIGSGPANSIRGAAYLTGSTDAIVVDVGGTSADVGVLVNGFPRSRARASRSAGSRRTSGCRTW